MAITKKYSPLKPLLTTTALKTPPNVVSLQQKEQEEYTDSHDMVVYMMDSDIPFSPTEQYFEPAKAYNDSNLLQIPDKEVSWNHNGFTYSVQTVPENTKALKIDQSGKLAALMQSVMKASQGQAPSGQTPLVNLSALKFGLGVAAAANPTVDPNLAFGINNGWNNAGIANGLGALGNNMGIGLGDMNFNQANTLGGFGVNPNLNQLSALMGTLAGNLGNNSLANVGAMNNMIPNNMFNIGANMNNLGKAGMNMGNVGMGSNNFGNIGSGGNARAMGNMGMGGNNNFGSMGNAGNNFGNMNNNSNNGQWNNVSDSRGWNNNDSRPHNNGQWNNGSDNRSNNSAWNNDRDSWPRGDNYRSYNNDRDRGWGGRGGGRGRGGWERR